MATSLRVTAGDFSFTARYEWDTAPVTCAAFEAVLPFTNKLIHARWCGEAAWIPLGDYEFGVGYENATRHPAPGHILLYPGGLSETEILVTYGAACFTSNVGPLAGNHFLTIVDPGDDLRRLGQHVLWNGATEIVFEHAED